MIAASLPLAAPAAISVQTALLVIMAGALFFMAKALLGLRARVEELELRARRTAEGAGPASPPPPARTPRPEEPVPAEVMAVIAAAVHVALKGQARIVGVSPQLDDQGWSREGRRQIFHSHKVR